MGGTPQIHISAVRDAVRELAEASETPVVLNYQFLSRVAEQLGQPAPTAADDPISHRHWTTFTGQVQRSLAWLAREGVLVKGRGAYGLLYRTPEQEAAHQAALRAHEQKRAERHAMRCRAHDELTLHGIPVTSGRGEEPRIEPDGWLRIIEALETARAVRSQV